MIVVFKDEGEVVGVYGEKGVFEVIALMVNIYFF